VARQAHERARDANPELVTEMETTARRSRRKIVEQAAVLPRKRAETLEKWAASTTGAAVVEGARALGRRAQDLPLISLTADLLQEKNGIAVLTQRIAADPADPMALVCLGDALQVLQRDSRICVAIRAALSPTSLLTREAVRTVTAAECSGAGPVELVMRAATGTALRRLRAQPDDPVALHAMARVYLAASMPDAAVVAGKLAVAAATSLDPRRSSSVLVTLARAYLAADHLVSADRAARMAIEAGSSLGWQVLADLVHRNPADETASERLAHYMAFRKRVEPNDLAAYHGFHLEASELLLSVHKLQMMKARALLGGVRRRRPPFSTTTK
jgi:hypothetical protein